MVNFNKLRFIAHNKNAKKCNKVAIQFEKQHCNYNYIILQNLLKASQIYLDKTEAKQR